MIYSILRHKPVPVTIEKDSQFVDNVSDDIVTRYSIYDSSKPQIEYVGYLDLQDTKNGVKVLYIRNEQPTIYKHFADVADQIEVEHCLNRNIDKPYIKSVAALNTHVLHFLRGKRFLNKEVNMYLERITKGLKKGKKIETKPLGCQKMYMPVSMINAIKEKIKINPLLKNLK